MFLLGGTKIGLSYKKYTAKNDLFFFKHLAVINSHEFFSISHPQQERAGLI
jgi:hypothetical protein